MTTTDQKKKQPLTKSRWSAVNSTQLLMEIFFIQRRRFDFVCTACFASWLHFLYITGSDGVKPGNLILSPLVTARMGSFCNGLKNVSKGLRDVKEGGISARKAGQMWGLSMKKSNSAGQTKWESDVWPSDWGPFASFFCFVLFCFF